MAATQIKTSNGLGIVYDFAGASGVQGGYILPIVIPAQSYCPGIQIFTSLDLVAGAGSTISFGLTGVSTTYFLGATLFSLFVSNGVAPAGNIANIGVAGNLSMTIAVNDVTAGIIFISIPLTKYVA